MTGPRHVLDARACERLRAARDWRLLALLFSRPHGGWWREVSELALGCDDPELARAAACARDANECDYLAVLGPGGPVSPREAGYRRTTDPARLLAEIRAYYQAFAFRRDGEDPPDHVAVQSSFLGWLCLKEAYALASGSAEDERVTAEAARDFLATHLACTAHGLAVRLEALGEGHLLHSARALVARAGPVPEGLEGEWVPSGFEERECAVTCGLAQGDEPGGDELPPEFTAGMRGLAQ